MPARSVAAGTPEPERTMKAAELVLDKKAVQPGPGKRAAQPVQLLTSDAK